MPLPTPVVGDSAADDEMTGAATVSYSTGSAPFSVRTSADEPAQVGVSAGGGVSVDVTMRNAAGDLFSLSGPAAVGGAQSGDHVSILSPKTGLYVDTDQGNACTVTYTRASEALVVGTARCDAQIGLQSLTVTASFHLG